MGKKVRSARGVEVDFDLLKIKQQIADAPNVNVTPRTEFVEKRLRRRTKRSTVPTPVAKVAEPEVPIEEQLEDALMDEIARGREANVEPEVRPVRKTK